MSDESTMTIIRNDPLRQLGQKVQKAIDLALEQPGESVQVSIKGPDDELLYVTVRQWVRR